MYIKNIFPIILFSILISACNDKKPKPVIEENKPETAVSLQTDKNKESIEGIYSSQECEFTLEITKTKEGYTYFLQTNLRKLKGNATFTKNESGEMYLILEDIKWDEYEGDISNEDETDSIPSKALEIPVGIDANYVKDTLTIQNYGNAMNSYTKISECGSKYIQLIKKN